MYLLQKYVLQIVTLKIKIINSYSYMSCLCLHNLTTEKECCSLNQSQIQNSSVTQLCLTLCHPKDCSMTNFPDHHQLLELVQNHVHLVDESSNYLILCCPLFLLPSIFPSNRIFSNEPVLCFQWSKYWSSSFIISPSNEYSGMISFRMDWLDLLAVQGTLKSLLRHHS